MNTFLAKKFIEYKLKAKDEHSLHSPFVFDFYCNVIKNTDASYYAYDELKSIRTALVNNGTTLEIEDFGAGSKHFKSSARKVCDIAERGITKEKYSKLLFRMIESQNCKTILELGTSLGMNTLYLAKANSRANVITCEGSRSLCNFARSLFTKLQTKNIRVMEGHFDSTFPDALSKINQFDFLFIDGNHRKEATLSYFNLAMKHRHNNSVIVLDDIYWSEEMEEAWKQIKSNPEVKVTIDLFQFGIVFFRNEHKIKEDYVLKF